MNDRDTPFGPLAPMNGRRAGWRNPPPSYAGLRPARPPRRRAPLNLVLAGFVAFALIVALW